MVFLLGKEGTGKTALLRWLARELEGDTVLVEGDAGLSSQGKMVLLWDDADRSSLWLDPQRAHDMLAGFSASILTGKTLPPALEMLVSRKGQLITLDLLSQEHLERFLDQRFPRLRSFDPALPWYPLTEGRLGWLLLLAHRMEREGPLAPDPLLFAVEILLHPASRRYAWRPEVYDHPLDALFFLAVVLPTWDRRDAEEITGQEIST
ncbi:MAG: hypothetical protein QJR00_08585, partial [Bacillota bacterium]|nr:hypothetical protein [Bacillota bacterium]